jgi:hypothetical protein
MAVRLRAYVAMTHDPLCPQTPGKELQRPCFYCELIDKTREGERNRWNTPYWSSEYHRGYEAGKAAAKNHVCPDNNCCMGEPN